MRTLRWLASLAGVPALLLSIVLATLVDRLDGALFSSATPPFSPTQRHTLSGDARLPVASRTSLPVTSRRVLPREMSGAYRFAGSFKRHPCPTSFNFGDGVAKDATKLSGYVYQGSVVLQGGATCEPTASITTVTTIFGQIPKSMAELGLSNGTRLLRTSNQPLVAWADSAGFFRGAWACGESPAWPDDTFVLWGDAALSWSSLGIRLKKGLRHMVFLTPKELMCAYSAPALAAGTPAPNGTTGGAGGGAQAGNRPRAPRR
ncbi:hypothetical protein BU14_0159s0036 [Porphyra umbilicalis]|uniref:Uncharacterized protein n=1 Tax=Porphyra umbilicalis TaxID=2786 RepID=A0A1X6P8G1_PORUM|nr:hypothetical protein BU14_0159s0036 [Porphyra umbilicalis]|eukprot:OSX77181.1 hypothetical protein BU14_0159s0036 [Porphyra umbilicalis]